MMKIFNHKIYILGVFALMLFSSACKTQFDELLDNGDAQSKYVAAFQYFEDKKYNKAGQLFESLSMVSSGTSRADTVEYYWAMSNYKQKDYYTAQKNFEHFITNYPNSPFLEMASFLKIDCMYRATYRYELDQTPTRAAIIAISEFMTTYSDTDKMDICVKMMDDLSGRLDRKAYESAYLYYKMEDYKAARVALKNVLKEDSDNRYREEILFYAAMSSYKYAELSIPSKQRERFIVFMDDYYNFVSEYPNSTHRPEIEKLYKKVKEK